MGDIFEVLSQVATIMSGINNNKVANFSYTNTAYNSDEVDGVASYDYTQEQNIPLPDNTDLDQSVRDKGIRSQSASLPRNAINHFFGRVSYNLNKITDMVISLTSGFASSMATNMNKYSPTAEYKFGDSCYVNVLFDGTNTRMQMYHRISETPETIQGVVPTSNPEHWEPLYSSFAANATQATNNTTIANTAFVHVAIDAYNTVVESALAGKAPVNHSAADGTYGSATTTLFGHVKLSETNQNVTTLVPTSSVLYTVAQTLENAIAGKAPIVHTDALDTYGAATTELFGHVKLSNTISDSTELVPTCAAVNNALAGMGSGVPIFYFDYRADNPSSNQTYTLPATGVPIGGMYVFRGQLYDIDDLDEYARFMSPSGLWLQLCIGVARYNDSHGSVNYRALGAFMNTVVGVTNDTHETGRPRVGTSAAAEQTKILNGSVELARTVYSKTSSPDSLELHWVGIKIG